MVLVLSFHLINLTFHLVIGLLYFELTLLCLLFDFLLHFLLLCFVRLKLFSYPLFIHLRYILKVSYQSDFASLHLLGIRMFPVKYVRDWSIYKVEDPFLLWVSRVSLHRFMSLLWISFMIFFIISLSKNSLAILKNYFLVSDNN